MTIDKLIGIRKDSWHKHRDITKDAELREAIARDYLLKDKSLVKSLQKRPAQMIELLFVIVDKEQQTVPFFLNGVQQSFVDDLERAKEDYRAGRRLNLNFIVLKGRQQGFTSVITAYQLAQSIISRNFSGFTLADNSDNTETIFSDKAKYPYEQLPEAIQPTEKYNNRRELHFENINSRWRVATAGKKDVGRSKTINFFHGSEVAFWDSGLTNMMAALGQALTKDSIKILESTANGFNDFKDLWDEGNWDCLFYEWWRTPEYALNFESDIAGARFKRDVKESKDWIYTRLKWLKDFHGLKWGQLYWYYHKWIELKDKIKQEYPCSADEAFIASGACVFDQDIIIQRKEVLQRKYKDNPYRVGLFTFDWHNADTKDYILDHTIRFKDDPNGHIRLYSGPKDGYPYVIGGDTKGEGIDYYTATVIDNVTGKRVAVLEHNWNNSKPYTYQVYCLGRYFNDALIGIETNWNTAPIEELQRLNYPNQYRRRRYDTYKGKYIDAFGWRTDGNTRPLIIDKQIDLIQNNSDLFTDIPMLDECLTFIYDKHGRPDAESGKHDDILFSDMIASEIRSQQTYTIKTPKEEMTEIQEYKERLARRLKRERRLS